MPATAYFWTPPQPQNLKANEIVLFEYLYRRTLAATL